MGVLEPVSEVPPVSGGRAGKYREWYEAAVAAPGMWVPWEAEDAGGAERARTSGYLWAKARGLDVKTARRDNVSYLRIEEAK
jgi:hypothetical protein